MCDASDSGFILGYLTHKDAIQSILGLKNEFPSLSLHNRRWKRSRQAASWQISSGKAWPVTRKWNQKVENERMFGQVDADLLLQPKAALMSYSQVWRNDATFQRQTSLNQHM